ncbi:MAG: hypothetical protein CMI27_02085 [Opitutae bacterium]|nr:hypothetical protein [Opitutae bacterium]
MFPALDQILFIDLEPYSFRDKENKVSEVGIVFGDIAYKSHSLKGIFETIKHKNPQYLCGHNIRNFDLRYLTDSPLEQYAKLPLLDTLELSGLLLPWKQNHKLNKSYKENGLEPVNDPLEDAKLTRRLLIEAIQTYQQLPAEYQSWIYTLLQESAKFNAFFTFLNHQIKPSAHNHLHTDILQDKKLGILNPQALSTYLEKEPEAIAHIITHKCPALKIQNLSPYVRKSYPQIDSALDDLCFNPEKAIEQLEDLSNEYFGFSSFRSFPRAEKEEDLFEKKALQLSQKEIVASALRKESFIAILPTGGGKTFCFWLPAIIKARATKALTVVVSPLQALIQDHLQSFNRTLRDHFQARSLSNITSKPKRRKILDDVRYGGVDLFYVTPESLRFRTVENALKHRYIERFVIDEAHCITGWGHVFRHDFFYITQFITRVTDSKYTRSIPVSLFTATATQACLKEIHAYIGESLAQPLQEFIADATRSNLQYQAQSLKDEDEKLQQLLQILKNEKDATLTYNPTSTKRCEDIAEHLSDSLAKEVLPFHAQLEDPAQRPQILQKFIDDDIFGIVATTAFGMGIDKPNIRNVIHMSLSPSLEEYMQESGRAGRDGKESRCIALFTDQDFDDLFFHLIRAKINHAEIRKVFQEIKHHRGHRVKEERKIYLSAHRIAESIGIAEEMHEEETKTRVQTAILELERCGYLRRGLNDPGVKLTSVHFRNMEEFYQTLGHALDGISQEKKETLILLAQKLIMKSSYAYTLSNLAEFLNTEPEEILEALQFLNKNNLVQLREDLEIYPKEHFRNIVRSFPPLLNRIEAFIGVIRSYNQKRFHLSELAGKLGKIIALKELNEVSLARAFFILLKKRGVLSFRKVVVSKNLYTLEVENFHSLTLHLVYTCRILSETSIRLDELSSNHLAGEKQSFLFCYYDLRDALSKSLGKTISVNELDSVFLFLEKVNALRLGGGKLIHNMQMELYLPLKLPPNKQYTKEDYSKRMEPMYQEQLESIHAMQYFMELLIDDSSRAQSFASDYFALNKQELVQKHDLSKRFRLPVSKKKYDQIMRELTPEQRTIVSDTKMQTGMIFAGPGTGKTSILIKKIAHMIVEEGHRPNHFIMLTFTRSACHEFRSRLSQLLGNLSQQIGVYTFHAYAYQLMSWHPGKENETLHNIIPQVTQRIQDGIIKIPLKTVLILDEFQDITEDSFQFVKTLYDQLSGQQNQDQTNTDLKLLAVGDDDQCIMELTTGASANFLQKYCHTFGEKQNKEITKYNLSYNFRSGQNIVNTCEKFASNIVNRAQEKIPMQSFRNQTNEVFLHQYSTPHCFTKISEIIKNSYDPDRHYSLTILTHTNEQVLSIYSLLKSIPLLKNEIQILLKQEGFQLSMLDEIQQITHFLETNIGNDSHIIEPRLFQKAKEHLVDTYKHSTKLGTCLRHLRDFETRYQTITLSIWHSFINEVTIEQFDKEQSSKIVISTIHRAKGKEFDEVHVVIPEKHHHENPDYFHRLYYVALSRAKTSLVLHCASPNLFQPIIRDCTAVHHHKGNNKPEAINRILIMTLPDSHLGFLEKQENADRLKYVNQAKIRSGENVEIKYYQSENAWNIVHQNKAIGQFSKNFAKNYTQMLNTHDLRSATIEYIAHWPNQNSTKTSKNFLCRLEFSTRQQKEA